MPQVQSVLRAQPVAQGHRAVCGGPAAFDAFEKEHTWTAISPENTGSGARRRVGLLRVSGLRVVAGQPRTR